MEEGQTKIRFILGLAIIIGATIGGGFWATPLVAGAIAGPISLLLTLSVFLVILLALPTYVTLARAWPVSPGHYYFSTRLLLPENRKISHLLGWLPNWAAIFIGGFTVTRYMTASGASFLNSLFPAFSTQIYTIILITISLAVLWFGIDIVGKTEVVLSTLLLISISVVVIYGLSQFETGNFTPVLPDGLSSTPAALAILFSLGAGPLLAIDISGEIEDPDTSVRNIILLGGAANVGFGLLIGVVVFGILPSAQMEGLTLSTVSQQNFPNVISLISGIGALLAGVSTNIGYIFIINRYADAATDDGILPDWLGKENRFGEPMVFLSLIYLISIVAIIIDLPLSAIASGFSFVLLGQAIMVLAVGARLPSQHPEVFELSNVKKSRLLRPGIVRWSSMIGAIISSVVFVYLASTEQVTFVWYVAISIFGIAIYMITDWSTGVNDMDSQEWPDNIQTHKS
jgi:APA family basic amino acid/polyamine antiporter